MHVWTFKSNIGNYKKRHGIIRQTIGDIVQFTRKDLI